MSAPPVIPASCRLLFICGDQSGVGKSSIALSLLHLLQTRAGYLNTDLAYIKPCTQCEDVQMIGKYCEQQGIQHRDLGPIIFSESVEHRHEKIKTAVAHIAQVCYHQSPTHRTSLSFTLLKTRRFLSCGKRLVIVDGVGYPSVGSVCGVSNAAVASLLAAPVVLISRPGIGNAIDATNYMRDYISYHHCTVLGVIFNKLPQPNTNAQRHDDNSNNTVVDKIQHIQHSYELVKTYTHKYFSSTTPPLSIYAHLPLLPTPLITDHQQQQSPGAAEEVSCLLRPAKTDLELTAPESIRVQQFLQLADEHIDIQALLRDLDVYYESHAAAEASK